MSDYSKMTNEDFVTHLHRVLIGISANDIFWIPGIYEILSEYFNNEVLESWEAEQEDET